MLGDFGLIPAFLILGVGFIAATLGLNHIIAPHNPNPIKNSPYECGEPAIGSGWFNYNMRFYAFALTFVVFDIELAVIYPLAVLYKEALMGGWALGVLVGILLFTGILFLGLVALWAKGDLVWSRELLHVETGGDVTLRSEKEAGKFAGRQEVSHAAERRS